MPSMGTIIVHTASVLRSEGYAMNYPDGVRRIHPSLGIHIYIPLSASAMRQRILGSHTPPSHKRMVITTQFSVLPCCTAAQTSSVPLQVAFDGALALAISTSGSTHTHHPPTVPVSL